MIKLDDNLLQELGLGNLPKDEKADFLKHMYETLEMRVGTRLAERMSEAQMTEFEQFIASNDEQGAFRWLEGNFPDYKDVVAEEFEKLKVEIKPVAAQIVAASAAGQGQSAASDASAASIPAPAPGPALASEQANYGYGPAPMPPQPGPAAPSQPYGQQPPIQEYPQPQPPQQPLPQTPQNPPAYQQQQMPPQQPQMPPEYRQ